MTVTRRSPRPSPRPQPREIDEEFAQQIEEWIREPAPMVVDDTVTADADETDATAAKKDDGPSRMSIGLVGVLAFIFVFGALFGLAAFHSVLVQNQLRLDRLSRDVEREQARYQSLRIEYGQAAAPFRILAQASARGMLQSKSKEPLQAVLPERGDLGAPNTHPFGNVQYFVPPVVTSPPTQTTTTVPTTAPTTTAPTNSAPTTTAPASAGATAPTASSPPPASSVTTTGARR
jgi:hypothetical protein